MHRSTAILLLAKAALTATTVGSWRAFVAERDRADALRARLDTKEPPVATAAADLAYGAVKPVDEAGATMDTQAESAAKHPEIFADTRRHLQSKAYRDAQRRVRTLELTSGFIDLAQVLGISQETADRLLALLVEKELEYLDRPQFNPSNEKEAAIRQLEGQQLQQARNAEISALIGADKLPSWEQYEASLSVRHEVRQMAASVFARVEPLREDQSEALIRAIHSERQRVRQELSEFTESLVWSGGMESQSHIYRGERFGELTGAANDRIHAAASSFLSPGQLAALDERLRHERELQEAEFQVVRAMMEAEEISDDEANSAARRSRQP
jgi:hypothetical protein